MKLKLINAERHACVAVGEGVTLKGQTVTVSEEVGKMLLDEVRTDALNNVHPVWLRVADGEEEDLSVEESEGEDSAAEDKPKRAARAARSAKA